MPTFPDLPDPLASGVAGLRLAAERDIPEVLIAHQDDPALHRALGMPRPPTGAELGRRSEEAAAQRAAGTSAWLTIVAGGDECRGQIDVTDVEWDHRRAELAIWIVARDRGRGLAAAALGLAGRWLLADCGLRRVQLLVEPTNEPMLRAAASAGFRREGVLRGYRRDQAVPRGYRRDQAVPRGYRRDQGGRRGWRGRQSQDARRGGRLDAVVLSLVDADLAG